jgi:nucleoside-diphosphate-sugar epimerase
VRPSHPGVAAKTNSAVVKVLVNGASGFFGPVLLQTLADLGVAGVAVSRRTISSVPARWEWRRRDDALRDPPVDVDTVIHLEVKQHVFNVTPDTIDEFHWVNVRGVADWLDWCDRCGVTRFVYVSSIKAVNPASTGATDEGASGPGDTLYGASKWQAEQAVAEWVEKSRSRRALVLRPAVMYGPGNAGNLGAMVSQIGRGRFVLVGKNANIKSVVAVENAAAATAHLLDRMEPEKCEIYCLTDPDSYTVRQLDGMIRAGYGKSGNSPTIPIWMARFMAEAGSLFERISGREAPINRQRLDALLSESRFSCAKLTATGFRHRCTTEVAVARLVWSYQQRPVEKGVGRHGS